MGVAECRRRRRKKRGGWRSLKGLRLEEVEQACALSKVASEARTPLNHFVTIRPTDEALNADVRRCKRWLSSRAKNIWQAVRGRGKRPRQATVPAVTVYEKRVGGVLHCHILLYVAPGNDALERFHDRREVDAKAAHRWSLSYALKSRLPIGPPEVDASYPLRRQGGQDAIRGARISMNADAKALLTKKGLTDTGRP